MDGNRLVYVKDVPWLPHLRALYLQDNEIVSLCPVVRQHARRLCFSARVTLMLAPPPGLLRPEVGDREHSSSHGPPIVDSLCRS